MKPKVELLNNDPESSVLTTVPKDPLGYSEQQDLLELKLSEARYRELADAGSKWYWETDTEHRFVHISKRIKKIAGADPQLLIGKTRLELADTHADPLLWSRYKTFLDERRPFRNFIYPMRPRFTEDKTRYFKINGTPRFTQHGDFIGYRGTAADVTTETFLLEQEKTAEQRFIEALESSADSISLYDPNERLVVSNAAWRNYQLHDFQRIPQPGTLYEDIVKENLATGTLFEANGREEQWLIERLRSFRNGSGCYELFRGDGRWLQIREQRTPSGATIVTTSDITTLKNRETKLKLSEQRFKDFTHAAIDWYFETDADLRVTYLSERYTEITGTTIESRLGHKVLLDRPDGVADVRWQTHLEDLKMHRPFRKLNYTRANPDGRTRYLQASGLPIFNEAGEFQGYRGTGLDNSSEILIRQTEERFRDVIETISDGYALYDSDDRLLIYNQNWLDILPTEIHPSIKPGIKLEEILCLVLKHRLYPRALGNEKKWLEHRMRLHRECGDPFELRIGENHWYLVRERRTRNQGVLLTITNITERKLRENALEKSESRFRDFAETAADWFWELDKDLRFSFVSERFHEITGMPVAELAGKNFKDLMSQSSLTSPGVHKTLLAFSEHRRVVDFEFECPGQHQDQTVHSINGVPLLNKQGEFQGYRGTGRDITQSRKLSVQLAYQASHDELTGLVNRREFEQRLTQMLKSSQNRQTEHALCYLDLDQFKVVNDTCGHAAGDALLQQLGRLLKDQVRNRDTLARLGGDEFALLLEHCTAEQAYQISDNLLSTISQFEFNWDNKHFRIGVSIGLVPIDNINAVSAAEILRAADSACYMAKDLGRNRIHVYTLHDTELVRRENEMQWVSQINKALAEDRFVLYGQVILPLNIPDNEHYVPHYEILLRMGNSNGETVPPGAFLPAAERYGLASRIDRWVVRNVFEWISEHPHLQPGDYFININLSTQSLGDELFQKFVIELFHSHRLSPEYFCFEITETAAIANLDAARDFMQGLRELGCRFALDDFGSGLSSYAYLRDLPVDYLKIDGSFIRNIISDPVHLAMVRSINDIGHVMGKQTVAEYVQDQATIEQLSELGIDFAQGYGIGHPMPLESLLG